MLFSFAWKNVFRNKLRSSLIVISVALGLTGGLFYMGFSNGMTQQQIDNTIKAYVANLQLHHPQYLLNDEIEFTIDNAAEKVAEILKIKEVKGASSKIRATAMIATGETGTGVFVYGIDPKQEVNVTYIHNKVVAGTYFHTKLRNPILIGQKLAKKLNVKPKSKVVITIQDTQGNLTSGLFKVAGIFNAENSIFEEGNVFVRKSDLANLIAFDTTKATEIAVLLKHNDYTDEVKSKIEKLFADEISSGKLAVQTWYEIQPMLKMMNDMTIQFTLIFLVIILAALGFGIVNTMLMSVMERSREFGMLLAVGMSGGKVFAMILLETLYLSLMGGFAGIIAAYALISYTAKTGIDLSAFAEGLNAWGYSSMVRPELGIEYYFVVTALIVLLALAVAYFPARKVLKINPAQAMRHEA